MAYLRPGKEKDKRLLIIIKKIGISTYKWTVISGYITKILKSRWYKKFATSWETWRFIYLIDIERRSENSHFECYFNYHVRR